MTPSAASTPPLTSQTAVANSSINHALLEELREDIGARFDHYLRNFIHSLTTDLAQFTQLRQQNRTELKRAAHNLKGLSALFGAERFANLCHQLELLAALDPPPAEEEPLIQTLLQEGEQIRQELQKGLAPPTA